MQKKSSIIIGILFIITSSFTPGGNGFYDSFFSAPTTSKVIRFFPNPATTVINFEFDKSVASTSVIAIYSFYGKKIISYNICKSRSLNIDDPIDLIYARALQKKTTIS